MRLRWLLAVVLVRVRTCLLKIHHLVGYTDSWIEMYLEQLRDAPCTGVLDVITQQVLYWLLLYKHECCTLMEFSAKVSFCI